MLRSGSNPPWQQTIARSRVTSQLLTWQPRKQPRATDGRSFARCFPTCTSICSERSSSMSLTFSASDWSAVASSTSPLSSASIGPAEQPEWYLRCETLQLSKIFSFSNRHCESGGVFKRVEKYLNRKIFHAAVMFV